MSDAISTFFDAWAINDADARMAKIIESCSADVQYADPRSQGNLSGVDALSEYVGMFSANAPGWSASVVKTDTTAETCRATVAFGGKGPDGEEMVQHGQYFVEFDGEKISRMVGFVGTGSPD